MKVALIGVELSVALDRLCETGPQLAQDVMYIYIALLVESRQICFQLGDPLGASHAVEDLGVRAGHTYGKAQDRRENTQDVEQCRWGLFNVGTWEQHRL